MRIYEDACYGCAACKQICPKQAIQMVSDPQAGMRPRVDSSRCSACRLCQAVCPNRTGSLRHIPKRGYAAVCTDNEILRRSASGGVFSALAKAFLECGGAVCGCIMSIGPQKFVLRHTMVERMEDLPALQGSKYAHSSTEEIYGHVKEQLKTGRPVLFSGTPCQIDGLYGFLRKERYDNLWTADLICHGVPPAEILEGYLSCMGQKNRIRAFAFRSKGSGWGTFAYKLTYRSETGAEWEIERPASRSSYYWLYLHGAIYRESCYRCPYAGMSRVADLTMGDWWGIEKEYPDYMGTQANQFQPSAGVSCLLVNTEHGEEALTKFGNYLKKRPTAPEAIARGNRQLQAPQVPPPYRELLMKLYQEEGYPGVERWYGKRLGYKRWAYAIWDRMTKPGKRSR